MRHKVLRGNPFGKKPPKLVVVIDVNKRTYSITSNFFCGQTTTFITHLKRTFIHYNIFKKRTFYLNCDLIFATISSKDLSQTDRQMPCVTLIIHVFC